VKVTYDAYGTVKTVMLLRQVGGVCFIEWDGDVYVCLPHDLREGR
jgi:hypothetical protein